jgi:hypothetical protein
VSPTYEPSARVLRELRKLPLEQRRAFLAARDEFVTALQHSPPQFPPGLRIKRVGAGAREGIVELDRASDRVL